MATKEVQEPTLHPPHPRFQPLLISPADHSESNLTAPIQLKRHAVELSLCVFMFHPNHSSGKERDSLPAEFPVPKRSPGTMKAVICIPQFPSVERVHPCWIHLCRCLPYQLFYLQCTVVCSLMLTVFQWFLFHVHSSWKAIRGRASLPLIPVVVALLLQWAQGRRRVYVCTRVCMHARSWRLHSFLNWSPCKFSLDLEC